MARCFITGVELSLEDAYVLDITTAHRALRELRQQAASLERLIQQLEPRDDIEFFNRRKRQMTIRKDRRLVSLSVAEALSAAYPQRKLFIKWTEWHSRRSNINSTLAESGALSSDFKDEGRNNGTNS